MALLTDLYQLTMSYGYWKSKMAEKESVFHLFFRKNPFKGGYAISCDVDAIPEGTTVFPHEPLLRIRGPIIQAQILETPLLNILNFQTLIECLKDQNAKISVWGVGTKLATAYDQPALGGVYKLSAIRNTGEKWKYKLKLSEQSIKISNPGILQVPMFKAGKKIYESPPLAQMRENALEELKMLHQGIKRFIHPHQYPVGLEKSLFDMKTELILNARGSSSSN